MAALVYYVLVYIFSNLAAFGVISSVERSSGKRGEDDYNGLRPNQSQVECRYDVGDVLSGGNSSLAGFFSKFFIFCFG